MMNDNISELLEELLKQGGLPRNVRDRLEETLKVLGRSNSIEEKVSNISSILDEASCDPNLSPSTRTYIWNVISTLEYLR
ncbi:MAG: UPF0147 family protein [Candidatus Aenigmarchaeota archaeon]|nr:UPF0147 family protein [Candidatus Aenigmarchaeota archaeon]